MHAGGLSGGSYHATVTDVYATGSVAGSNNAAGLIARIDQTNLSNSYATGALTGGTTGGLTVSNFFATVTTSFWDTDTTGAATSAHGTGKTTVQMQTATTFTGASWNDTTIWNISNGSYPTLR